MTQLALSLRLSRLRAIRTGRAVRSIARDEPAWLVGVVALAGWGLVLVGPRFLHPARPWLPAALVVLLAALLEATRSDERLVALLGGRFALVRFVDAMLWLSPLLVLLAVRSPAGALLAVLGIGGVALVPVGKLRTRRSSRAHRARARLVALGALEWAAGLRRTPWPLVVSTLVGVVGPANPLLVVAPMLVATVTATSYHWAPAEGWLLIHVARRTPRGFLWRKVGVSCALLALALGAILASALLRAPELALVFTVTAVLCLHAHACGILCRYAEYEEGAPLSAGGTLMWVTSSALLAFPPAAAAAVYLLERRAVARLAPYCRHARREAR